MSPHRHPPIPVRCPTLLHRKKRLCGHAGWQWRQCCHICKASTVPLLCTCTAAPLSCSRLPPPRFLPSPTRRLLSSSHHRCAFARRLPRGPGYLQCLCLTLSHTTVHHSVLQACRRVYALGRWLTRGTHNVGAHCWLVTGARGTRRPTTRGLPAARLQHSVMTRWVGCRLCNANWLMHRYTFLETFLETRVFGLR